jgi:hypothetical protein
MKALMQIQKRLPKAIMTCEVTGSFVLISVLIMFVLVLGGFS